MIQSGGKGVKEAATLFRAAGVAENGVNDQLPARQRRQVDSMGDLLHLGREPEQGLALPSVLGLLGHADALLARLVSHFGLDRGVGILSG